MHFASSHVYTYDCSDEESVSEDELEHGMRDQISSDDDSGGRSGLSRQGKEKKKSHRGSLFQRLSQAGANLFGRASPSTPMETTTMADEVDSAGKPLTPSAPTHSEIYDVGSSALKSKSKPPLHSKRSTKWQQWRKADTNVVSIRFDTLTLPSNMHTGDPVYCSQCFAVLSHLSKLVQEGDQQVWHCEFCGTANIVDLEPEEIPKQQDVTFMLQPAPCTTASGKSGVDESLIVFCVDISGSMCVTTEVPGRVKLRGFEKLQRLQSLNEEHQSQRFPGQKRNVTYISRLQSVQAAVDHQLGQMMKDHPDRRIALITFSNEVIVMGDGTVVPTTLTGDKLNDKTTLMDAGTGLVLPKAIKETRKTLGDKLFDVEEGGATALGPALLVAVSMASQVKGSKVIICTDGMANVGLGNLDSMTTEEEEQQVTEFFDDVSQVAVDSGVSVSMITIKGTDCRLAELGKVADRTGGQVNIVDPLKLTEEFSEILAEKVIATHVNAKFVLHNQLYFREEENVKDNCAIRNVGNATAETEITFEFGVRKDLRKASSEPKQQGEAGGSEACTEGATSQVEELSELPFQLQIAYTDLDGAQALRMLTQTKPITKDRSVAEKNMNVTVLGVHTAQKSARAAIEGRYTEARLNAISHNNMLKRGIKKRTVSEDVYSNFYQNVNLIDANILQRQNMEIAAVGHTYSDDESGGEEMEVPSLALAPPPKQSLKKKLTSSKSRTKQMRHRETDDSSASTFYQSKQISAKSFTSGR